MATLLVASGGGHLKQLMALLPCLDVGDDVTWVTFDTGLARSLAQHSEVLFAPYAHPHDLGGTARDAVFAMNLMRERKFDRVISTGANLAVAFLPIARVFGAKAFYIETATRSDGLSVTGRILDKIPGIKRYVQHRNMENKRWRYGGSVFEGFVPEHAATQTVKKVVVTLGSNESYGFDRLLRRLVEIIPSDVEVTWQTGVTELKIFGAREMIPAAELESALAEADVVVAHSGTGSALTALEAGLLPVLAIRRAAYGEHIDDHQELTGRTLADRGLALAIEADELTWQDLVDASAWKIQRITPPKFRF